jgi:hypothetical protein
MYYTGLRVLKHVISITFPQGAEHSAGVLNRRIPDFACGADPEHRCGPPRRGCWFMFTHYIYIYIYICIKYTQICILYYIYMYLYIYMCVSTTDNIQDLVRCKATWRSFWGATL